MDRGAWRRTVAVAQVVSRASAGSDPTPFAPEHLTQLVGNEHLIIALRTGRNMPGGDEDQAHCRRTDLYFNVPRNYAGTLHVHQGAGEVAIHDLAGAQELRVLNISFAREGTLRIASAINTLQFDVNSNGVGNLHVAGAVSTRSAHMSAMSGAINIVGVIRATHRIRIQTVSGTITTKNNNGHYTDKFNLLGEEVDTEGSDDKAVRRRTVGFLAVSSDTGAVELDGIRGAHTEVTTVSGAVTVLLRKCSHFYGDFDIQSDTGAVTVSDDSGFLGHGDAVTARKQDGTGQFAKGTVCADHGTLSAEGVATSLRVRSVSGDITVQFLAPSKTAAAHDN